jgi:EAL domain-containing protein (putative c-di-GMP-specific phosphodiesterase class I)
MFSTIQDLKDMGVMLAIDDFGTGYSSLGYLRQFKVNRLKIARSFIQDVSVDPDDAAITTAIIEMARALNLAVLAEGVENEAQLSFLQSQQCHTIQGFYFSRPVAVEQIDEHLRSGFSQYPGPTSIQ